MLIYLMKNVIVLFNYKIQIFIINFTIKFPLEGDSLFIQLDENKKNNVKSYIFIFKIIRGERYLEILLMTKATFNKPQIYY